MDMRICALRTLATTGLIGLAGTSYGQDTTTEETFGGFGSYLLSSHFDKDFGVSVGLKGWFNRWETSTVTAETGTEGNTAGAFVTADTSEDVQFTPIPVLSLRYKNFLISGSLYPSTDFDFPLQSRQIIPQDVNDNDVVDGNDAFFLSQDLSAERNEWDISGGYYLSRYIAILAGYKKITQDFKRITRLLDSAGDPIPGQETPSESTTEISGPIVGVAVSAPIGRGFGFFGSYAHGFLESEFDNGTDADSPYDLLEAGISYTYLPPGTESGFVGTVGNYVAAVSGYLGYRFQRISTEFEDLPGDLEGPDTTEGFTVGINVSF